jgi:hypothetical protein
MLKSFFTTILLAACMAKSQKPEVITQQNVTPSVKNNGLVILELFTSEGCSSCPPADKLAAVLQEEYADKLFVLAFHVDYWNRLGWKDIFSNATYTERQLAYSRQFQLEGVYTPQAVINGAHEGVGSDKTVLKRLIDNELTDDKVQDFTFSAIETKAGTITVNSSYKAATGEVINFALVQKQITVDVKAGENKGRELTHTNVVRDFISTPIGKANASVNLIVPAGIDKSLLQLIAYVQNSNSGNIVAVGNLKSW